MPKRINVPGVGGIDFPDSMDDGAITQAIERDILPKHAPTPGLWDIFKQALHTPVVSGMSAVTPGAKPLEAGQIPGPLPGVANIGEGVKEYGQYLGMPKGAPGEQEMRAKGLTDIFSGAADMLAPSMGKALAAKPLEFAARLGLAGAAGWAGEKGAEKLGAGPATSAMAGAVSSVLPLTGLPSRANRALRPTEVIPPSQTAKAGAAGLSPELGPSTIEGEVPRQGPSVPPGGPTPQLPAPRPIPQLTAPQGGSMADATSLPKGTAQEPLTGPPTISAMPTRAVGSDVYKQPGEVIKPETEAKLSPKTIEGNPGALAKSTPFDHPQAQKFYRLMQSQRDERFQLERQLATGRFTDEQRAAGLPATVEARVKDLRSQEARSMLQVARYSKGMDWNPVVDKLEQTAVTQLMQAKSFEEHIQADRNVESLMDRLQFAKPKEKLAIRTALGFQERQTASPVFLEQSKVSKPETLERIRQAREMYSGMEKGLLDQMKEKGFLSADGTEFTGEGNPEAEALRKKWQDVHGTLYSYDEEGVRSDRMFLLRKGMARPQREVDFVKTPGGKSIISSKPGSFSVQEAPVPGPASLSLDVIRQFMGLTQKDRVLGKLTRDEKDRLASAPAEMRKGMLNEIVRQHFGRVAQKIRETGEHNANLAKAIRQSQYGGVSRKASDIEKTIHSLVSGGGPNVLPVEETRPLPKMPVKSKGTKIPSAPKAPPQNESVMGWTRDDKTLTNPQFPNSKIVFGEGNSWEHQYKGEVVKSGDNLASLVGHLGRAKANVNQELGKDPQGLRTQPEAQGPPSAQGGQAISPAGTTTPTGEPLQGSEKPLGKGLSKTIGPKPPKGSDPTEQGFIKLSVLWPGSWFNNPGNIFRHKITERRTGQSILNMRGAEMALDVEKFVHQLDDIVKAHRGDDVNALIRIFDAVEGKPGSTPLSLEEQAAADSIKDAYNRMWDVLRHLKVVDQDSIEDYVRRIFKGRASQRMVDDMMRQKRPFEGTSGFMRERFHDFFSDAVRAGADPITNNFFEMQLLGLRQVAKYTVAHLAAQDYKNAGIAKWFQNSAYSVTPRANASRVAQGRKPVNPVPDGWQKFDDKIFKPMAYKDGAFVKYGEYWGPKEVVKDFNNYLSPGLQDNWAFNLVRNWGNFLNRFQLGASLFHGGTTTFLSMGSDMANAMVGTTRGMAGMKYVPGMLMKSAIPAASVTSYGVQGARFKSALLNPGSDPQMEVWGRYLIMGGGRLGLDPMWKNDAARKMFKDWHDPKFWRKAKALGVDLPMFANEKAMAPIFEHLVPNVKLGAALQMMKMEVPAMEARGASQAEIAIAMGKIMRSVDNRFGQVTYDNYHMNKYLKDIAMVTFRAVGWDYGEIDEFFGGARDIYRTVVDKEPLNWRTTFFVGMAITTAFAGLLLGKLLNGPHWEPSGVHQLYHVPSGYLGENGDEINLQLPTYMKDAFSAAEDPRRTLFSKLNPWIEQLDQLSRNEDYYGQHIYKPYDDRATKLKKGALYVAEQLEPLSVRNYQYAKQNEQPTAISALSFIGITPAPKWLDMTKAEALAAQLSRDMNPAITQGDGGHAMARMRGALKSQDPERIKAAARDVTSEQLDRAINDIGKTKLQRYVGRLKNSEDILAVWNAADKSERVAILDDMLRAGDNLAKLPEDDRERLMPKFEEALSQR